MSNIQEQVSQASDALSASTATLLTYVKEKVIGRIVYIRAGEYKDRYGRITAVQTDFAGKILFMAPPFRKNARGEYLDDLLNDRADARSFWHLNNLTIVNTKDEYIQWMRDSLPNNDPDVDRLGNLWDIRYGQIKHLFR